MAHILQNVTLKWNDDIDNVLVNIESDNNILVSFFTIKDWDIIKAIHDDALAHVDCSFEDKALSFISVNGIDFVDVITDEGEVRLHLQDFYTLLQQLFDIMIDGANEDHHSVRYEPWFESFTQNANTLRRLSTRVNEDSNQHYVYEAFIAEQGY